MKNVNKLFFKYSSFEVYLFYCFIFFIVQKVEVVFKNMSCTNVFLVSILASTIVYRFIEAVVNFTLSEYKCFIP